MHTCPLADHTSTDCRVREFSQVIVSKL
jgi:hypothetical protein